MRIPYETMQREFLRVLAKHGITGERAALCARLFADASRDGVPTHGLNRFPRFIKAIERGAVDPAAQAEAVERLGMLERWDGHRGPGNLNAHACMQRAIELARAHTIGVVALRNTNHWMRPGNYGLMAAEAGCIGILWTNTMPNMPPWGGRDARIGNNPVVFAIPHGDTPMLLDAAMSMFSYGKLESYARQGRQLPVDGGFNRDQQLTRDPREVLETHQCLPIGYWKGSGLSLALDLVAAALSGGNTARQVGASGVETGLSQVFVAIDVAGMPDGEAFAHRVADTLADLQTSTPVEPGCPPRYPGQNMMRVRADSLRSGIPVEDSVWEEVLRL